MTKIKAKLFRWLLRKTGTYQMTFDKEKWKLIETDNLIVVVEKDYTPKEDIVIESFYIDNNEPYYTVGGKNPRGDNNGNNKQ